MDCDIADLGLAREEGRVVCMDAELQTCKINWFGVVSFWDKMRSSCTVCTVFPSAIVCGRELGGIALELGWNWPVVVRRQMGQGRAVVGWWCPFSVRRKFRIEWVQIVCVFRPILGEQMRTVVARKSAASSSSGIMIGPIGDWTHEGGRLGAIGDNCSGGKCFRFRFCVRFCVRVAFRFRNLGVRVCPIGIEEMFASSAQ